MSEFTLSATPQPGTLSTKAIQICVTTWFTVAAVGHWIFVVYILAVFYPPVAQHGPQGLEGLHLSAGFREGETLANLAAVGHVLIAALIIGGGPLQLIPSVRSRAPRFHRWLGRSYLVAVVMSAIGGLYLLWTRGSVGNVINHIGTSGSAVLILVFAVFTVRSAVTRRIVEHRRWAMRLFLAASAVWFFRVGLMGWTAVTGGVGIDFETFTGPFIYTLSFAQYLLPLAMLEWYFRCKSHEGQAGQLLFVVTLYTLTGFMALGIGTATVGMWLPLM